MQPRKLVSELTRSSSYVPLSERSRGVAARLPRMSRAGFGASGARSMAAGAPSEAGEGPAPELPRSRGVCEDVRP